MHNSGSRWAEVLLLVLSLVALVFLSTYKLEIYPRTWFDEAENLQVPKNLVLHGEYALRSSEGFRVLDPALTTGPTVVLPIALVFNQLGIGLLQARLVMAVYLLLAFAAFYALGRYLYGWKTAFIGLWLLVCFPAYSGSNALYLGRMVMGNVPALFYFVTGALLWMRSLDAGGRHGGALAVASGLTLGLAMVTKTQYGLVIPALAIVWAADRLHYRQPHWSQVLVPLVVSVAALLTWHGAKLAILGPQGFAAHMASLGSVSSASVAVFSPRKILGNAYRVATSSFLFLGVPGLFYCCRSCLDRRLSSVKRLFLVSFIVVWLSWYVFASIGWKRYYFAPVAVSNLFAAGLFADLIHDVRRSLEKIWQELKRGHAVFPSLSIWASLLLLLLIACPLQKRARSLVRANDRTPQRFAQFLDEHVNSDALIETWEWELAFLTDHIYHLPGTQVLNAKTLEGSLGIPFPADGYDPWQHNPDYLVDGSFSKSTSLYPQDYLRQNCLLVKTIGNYDLYELSGCIP